MVNKKLIFEAPLFDTIFSNLSNEKNIMFSTKNINPIDGLNAKRHAKMETYDVVS